MCVCVCVRARVWTWQENKGYDKLMQFWLANKYTLRYTGGMVPDVNQVSFFYDVNQVSFFF